MGDFPKKYKMAEFPKKRRKAAKFYGFVYIHKPK